MKTLLTLTAVAFIFTAASAQERTSTATPQPLPMAAPAMKVQNTQQNSQNSTAPKSTGTSTETKEATKGTAAPKSAEAAPPVDNKIAVSDPGAPGDKANTKKAADTKSSEKKGTPTSGVSPK